MCLLHASHVQLHLVLKPVTTEFKSRPMRNYGKKSAFPPLTGNGLVLPLPSGLEVIAEFKPEHKNMGWWDILFARTRLHPKVLHQVMEAKRRS